MLFLQILKIIGLVLLGIIGLVLLAAGLVLFVPVRYKLHGIKNEETMSVDGEVHWLLKLVSIKVHYDKGGLRKQGRIAFFKFLKDDEPEAGAKDEPKAEPEPEPKGEPKAETEAEPNIELVEHKNTPESAEQEEHKGAVVSEEEKHVACEDIISLESEADSSESDKNAAESADSDVSSEKAEETSETEEHSETEDSDRKKERRKKVRKEKSKELTFIKRLKNLFVNRDYVSLAIEKKRPAIDKALKRVGKIITHILPRKVYGRLEFGFDDPSTTGKVLGVIAVLYGRMGEVFKVYPDFQQQVLDCDIKIKGKIRIFTVLLLAALVYFNRDLRKLFKYLKHCTEVDIYEEHLEKQKEKENGRK